MKYLARIFGEKVYLWNPEKNTYGVYYKLWGKYYFWRMAKE